MHARVARFEVIDVTEAERTLADAEEVIRPLVEGLDGYRGRLQLLGGDGEVLSVALFDSEQALLDAEPTFDEEMPRALGSRFGPWQGRRVSVARYRVVADDRP